MRSSFIKRRWPTWVRLLLSPIAFIGATISLPIIIVFVLAGFNEGEKIMEFWTEPQ